nr:immunoglobulin light chain junction region [Macaca mulatta]MOX22493.1 immunoglobulin light chain junction region [Macaca mulatta]MOX23149.1 immunoglobulin light chain junction region [Macaca mulatta]
DYYCSLYGGSGISLF